MNRLVCPFGQRQKDSHLNRAISDLIQNAGFHIEQLDTGYMPGPKMMTFMYEGSARPA